MKFRGEVTVSLKKGIFDPQGAAVKNSLVAMGYGEVETVRMGKHIVISFDARSPEEAKRLMDEMARGLLANPVIETYEIKIQQD